MNAATREQIRLSLLRHLDANAGQRFGLSESVLLMLLRNDGFRLTADELRAELAYLEGKQLAAPQAKAVSPENRAWQITATGRDHYAQLAE